MALLIMFRKFAIKNQIAIEAEKTLQAELFAEKTDG